MTNHSLREVEDGFWQMKTELSFWGVVCHLVHALIQKEIAIIFPAADMPVDFYFKRILLAIDSRGQKHFMSFSVNQSQLFWQNIMLLEQEAVIPPVNHTQKST